MNTFDIIAFTFALSAMFFSFRNHERINALEKKLDDRAAAKQDPADAGT
jgi:hypothetical protein